MYVTWEEGFLDKAIVETGGVDDILQPLTGL